GHRARCGRDAKRRVVVVGVVAEGTAIDRLVSGLLEVLDDLLFELVSGVVRTEVDAHARHLYSQAPPGASRRSQARRSRAWRGAARPRESQCGGSGRGPARLAKRGEGPQGARGRP